MPRSNRSHAVRISYAPVCDEVLVDALVRSHRDFLVATAAHHLRSFRADAEDVVQDVCLAVMEGDVALSSDPSDALDDLVHAVIAAAQRHLEGE
jgi:hypothetical protein